KGQKYEMNPSKLLFASILGLAISLSVLLTVSLVDQIHAAKYPYDAALSGQNEVPPVETSATGEAEFTVPANDTMKYRINVTGIMNASAAHIHMAKEGENGEVIADLLNTPTSKDKDTAYGMIFRGNLSDSSLKGPMQGQTLDDLATAMDSGEVYVNVHTAANPDGEIRGQIINSDKPQAETTNSTEVGFSTLTE
ncbi:MAG TPA: CHRD domain-containing protein, partial [Nitrososphaeraceae archaeon]|nr:CHRD domain-containing protein [Nitrososphaeraceae archaeon]